MFHPMVADGTVHLHDLRVAGGAFQLPGAEIAAGDGHVGHQAKSSSWPEALSAFGFGCDVNGLLGLDGRTAAQDGSLVRRSNRKS